MMDKSYVQVTTLFISHFLSTILESNEKENSKKENSKQNICYTLKAVKSRKFIAVNVNT